MVKLGAKNRQQLPPAKKIKLSVPYNKEDLTTVFLGAKCQATASVSDPLQWKDPYGLGPKPNASAPLTFLDQVAVPAKPRQLPEPSVVPVVAAPAGMVQFRCPDRTDAHIRPSKEKMESVFYAENGLALPTNRPLDKVLVLYGRPSSPTKGKVLPQQVDGEVARMLREMDEYRASFKHWGNTGGEQRLPRPVLRVGVEGHGVDKVPMFDSHYHFKRPAKPKTEQTTTSASADAATSTPANGQSSDPALPQHEQGHSSESGSTQVPAQTGGSADGGEGADSNGQGDIGAGLHDQGEDDAGDGSMEESFVEEEEDGVEFEEGDDSLVDDDRVDEYGDEDELGSGAEDGNDTMEDASEQGSSEEEGSDEDEDSDSGSDEGSDEGSEEEGSDEEDGSDDDSGSAESADDSD